MKISSKYWPVVICVNRRQHGFFSGKVSIMTLSLYFLFFSCDQFVDDIGTPQNQIVSEDVFSNDQSAESAIRGIYGEMVKPSNGFANGSSQSIAVLLGLASDEFNDFSVTTDYGEFRNNVLSPSNSLIANALWGRGYKYIYYVNSILEGIEKSNGLSQQTKGQLKGEAMFIRAFCNFYLVNIFGEIPLITTTDYTSNRKVVRKSVAEIEELIISDLLQASVLLKEDYSVSGSERVRPCKWTAYALLARVYLHSQDWNNAILYSSRLIESPLFELPGRLDDVFLAKSKEAIWQLMPLSASANTEEGLLFILESTPVSVAIPDSLIAAFESGDARLVNWIGSVTVGKLKYYYPFKYKIKNGATPKTEYSMVFRLAEQYLIRAEAKARLNLVDESLMDLNKIRSRSGLKPMSQLNLAGGQSSLLAQIWQEKRMEFFSEWGHRWLDLKRTNRLDTVLGKIKPNWKTDYQLFPIPKTELDNNPNLTQNKGY